MKIVYACINQSLKCKKTNTFRIKNYSQERLIEVIKGNLECLFKILEFNIANHIHFFRIRSDLIPFVSRSIMDFDWQDHFESIFNKLTF